MTYHLADYKRVAAPDRTTRLVPSRFPPISAFETVVSKPDLEAVMELEGWTNDRLVSHRLARLDPREWAFGRPNASIVMAAFLHGSLTGMRFSGPDFGAWYAASDLTTAVLEIANGLRKEMSLTQIQRKRVEYRQYLARLAGEFVDVFGIHPEFHRPEEASYTAPQGFGAVISQLGPDQPISGIRYESVRHPGHENWVSFRPNRVEDVTQGVHLELDVPTSGKVVVRRLAA